MCQIFLAKPDYTVHTVLDTDGTNVVSTCINQRPIRILLHKTASINWMYQSKIQAKQVVDISWILQYNN